MLSQLWQGLTTKDPIVWDAVSQRQSLDRPKLPSDHMEKSPVLNELEKYLFYLSDWDLGFGASCWLLLLLLASRLPWIVCLRQRSAHKTSTGECLPNKAPWGQGKNQDWIVKEDVPQYSHDNGSGDILRSSEAARTSDSCPEAAMGRNCDVGRGAFQTRTIPGQDWKLSHQL